MGGWLRRVGYRRRVSEKRGGCAVGVVAGLAVCAVIVYAALTYLPPLLRGTGCEASTPNGDIQLTVDQMENAATIAAVAKRERLPRRAVTIALAAAFQESKLQNVPYGDRDSVGLFQQRPSQGWGRRAQLLDPVYASAKFYQGLVGVEGYRSMPVHEAAQAVQRSADGSAYAQHEANALILATVLTGGEPGGLRCWFEDPVGELDIRALRTKLTREFGPRVEVQAAGTGLDVRPRGKRHGWTVALWAVANAPELGVASVEYRGRRWTAEDGYAGWQPAENPAPGAVRIRGET